MNLAADQAFASQGLGTQGTPAAGNFTAPGLGEATSAVPVASGMGSKPAAPGMGSFVPNNQGDAGSVPAAAPGLGSSDLKTPVFGSGQGGLAKLLNPATTTAVPKGSTKR